MDLAEKIIKYQSGPEKYAAIYARKSIKNQNDSLLAQKQLGMRALEKNELLLYRVYEDEASGRRLPSFKRKGFGELISDARTGYFKTVVTYRHDRLSRDADDWLLIKNEFKRLGIKVIFTDVTEIVPTNTPISNFVENLMITIAELEPNQILKRTMLGIRTKREDGIYNPAGKNKDGLFGYIRISEDPGKYIKTPPKKRVNITSYYREHLLCAFFCTKCV